MIFLIDTKTIKNAALAAKWAVTLIDVEPCSLAQISLIHRAFSLLHV
jgi:hypothetical protein